MKRAVAGLLVAVLIVTVILYIPGHHFFIRASAFQRALTLVPATLLLLVTSAIAAMLLAGCITWLQVRSRALWIAATLFAIAIALALVPVYWTAVATQITAQMHGIPPTRLNFFLPAGVLMILQVAPYTDCLGKNPPSALFSAFALLLPALLSADMLVEVIFAWPGLGRSLIRFQQSASEFFAALVLEAAFVLIVRAVSSAIDRRKAFDLSLLVEPL